MDLSKLESFVAECYQGYLIVGLEPGNPFDGDWELAHHPVPKCLGGTETIWLLKRDHAVHGVIQSDCFEHCCIYGWEYQFLEGELLERARNWKAHQGRLSLAKHTHQMRSEYSRRREANKTHEEKQRKSNKIKELLRTMFTPDQRSKRARHASLSMTKEQRIEAGRRGGQAAAGKPRNVTDDERQKRAERARERNRRMNSTIYEDPNHPELGRHNLGNLVKAQKKAGLPCGKDNRREV